MAGPLAAVVGTVAGGPLDATRDRVAGHAAVVEELANRRTVLPMRFGVVFADEAEVRSELLDPRRPRLLELLDQLEGKVELRVRAVVDQTAVLRDVTLADPAIRRLRERTLHRSPEAAYYDLIRLGELVAAALQDWKDRTAAAILEELAATAVAIRSAPPAVERQVVDASLLVRAGDVDAVEVSARRLEAASAGRIRLRVIGPLPPWSFVGFDERPGASLMGRP